jgi:hypothetical protein
MCPVSLILCDIFLPSTYPNTTHDAPILNIYNSEEHIKIRQRRFPSAPRLVPSGSTKYVCGIFSPHNIYDRFIYLFYFILFLLHFHFTLFFSYRALL